MFTSNNKDVNQWLFNYVIRQLKKEKKIISKKDGKIYIFTKYLNDKDDMILQYLRE